MTDAAQAEFAEIQRQGAIFSPEGVSMLLIFGVLDIIDFFIGSILIVDIIATLFYFAWIYFRSQVKTVIEGEERRAELPARSERARAQRTARAPRPKGGKWFRRSMFVLEWIPIIGMIPGWTLMVYSELRS